MKTNPLVILVLAAAGFALSACALEASTDPVVAGSQPVYTTGSNIAKSRTPPLNGISTDSVTTVTGEQAERALRGTPSMPSKLPGSN
jgi:hypothetical protein